MLTQTNTVGQDYPPLTLDALYRAADSLARIREKVYILPVSIKHDMERWGDKAPDMYEGRRIIYA